MFSITKPNHVDATVKATVSAAVQILGKDTALKSDKWSALGAGLFCDKNKV